MRLPGLRSIVRRRFRVTTNSKHRYPVAPDRLQRNFTAQRPTQVWVSDITYLRVGCGWLYLAVFIDLYSRPVVGWALSSSLDPTLVLTALPRAVALRRPPRGSIIHSSIVPPSLRPPYLGLVFAQFATHQHTSRAPLPAIPSGLNFEVMENRLGIIGPASP